MGDKLARRRGERDNMQLEDGYQSVAGSTASPTQKYPPQECDKLCDIDLGLLEHAGRLWRSHNMARAWRSWRVKAKSKHVAKIQGPGFLRLVGIVEAILPCLPLCFSLLPPLFEAFAPCLYLWPLYVVLSAYWLRCALSPPSLFFFGVAASEFPLHPLLGHVAHMAVWASHVAWEGRWDPSTGEAILVVACLVCNACLCLFWGRLVRLQLGARAGLQAALSGTGIEIPSHDTKMEARLLNAGFEVPGQNPLLEKDDKG